MNIKNLFSTSQQSSMWQKRIPTFLGLGVLILGLIGGTFLITTGPGVFAPRASAETTPKAVKVSNISDTGFTVSFYTDGKTTGFVKHGTTADATSTTTMDDRDQLKGSSDNYNLHYVTVRGLTPDTNYFFTLGTGGGTFDDAGKPYTVKTGAKVGAAASGKVLQGTLSLASGAPANGGIIYAKIDGVGEMSSLSRTNGSWFIPLSNARSTDGSQLVTVSDDQTISLSVIDPQASNANKLYQTTTSIKEADPTLAISLGASSETSEITVSTTSGKLTDSTSFAPESGEKSSTDKIEASPSPTVNPKINRLPPTQLPPATDDPVILPPSTATPTPSPTASGSSTTSDSGTTENQTGTTGNTAGKSSTTDSETQTSDNQESTSSLTGDDIFGGSSSSGDSGSSSDDLFGDSSSESSSETSSQSTTQTSTTTTGTGGVGGGTGNEQLAQANTATAQAYSSSSPYSSPNPTASAAATATPSARTTLPSTASGIPVSGSVGTTLTLVFGGAFFLISGLWSFWLARQVTATAEVE